MSAGTCDRDPLAHARLVWAGWSRDPARFVATLFDTEPEPWQAEALRALASHDRIAIRSGHGVGKSAFLAWAILWWLLTRFPAKVAATAPTQHQLQDVLWGEIAKWRRRLPPVLQAQILVKSDRVELVRAGAEHFAVARTARRDQPEAFQGFHSDHMLFVVDEASGVDDAIFEAGQGALSSPGAKTILCGNPTRTRGQFFDAFHTDRPRWWTRRVGCAESSRVAPGWIAEMRDRWGEDSAIFRVRVLGEFPTDDDAATIPLHLVEAAVDRDIAPRAVAPVWGLDVARFGQDRTALIRRRGNVVTEPAAVWSGLDTMQVTGRVAEAFAAAADEDRPAEIMVDVIGLGAGVVDRLRELGLPVRGINVAEAAAVSERYARLRDELWFRARAWFEARDCRLVDDQALIGELTQPHYGVLSNGKIKVEGKDEMKRRGLRSPDLADAFVLTFAGAERRVDPARYAARRAPNRSWMGA